MLKFVPLTCLFATGLFVACFAPINVQAENFARGQGLFEDQCHGCHGDLGIEKKTAKAKTVDELRKKIASWAEHGGTDWGDSEIDDVLLYLNKSFYRFKTEKF